MYNIHNFQVERKPGLEWLCGLLTVPEEAEKLEPLNEAFGLQI